MQPNQQANHDFHLDPETGILYWKNVSKYHLRKNGQVAGHKGTTNGKHYWVIRWNKKSYKRGQLVYLMTHGVFPKPVMDHINGDSLDDRPSNLRAATITENAWNHSKRKRTQNLPMGIRVTPTSGKFVARIGYMKKQITIGTFDKLEDAVCAYQSKRKELYGDFA